MRALDCTSFLLGRISFIVLGALLKVEEFRYAGRRAVTQVTDGCAVWPRSCCQPGFWLLGGLRSLPYPLVLDTPLLSTPGVSFSSPFSLATSPTPPIFQVQINNPECTPQSSPFRLFTLWTRPRYPKRPGDMFQMTRDCSCALGPTETAAACQVPTLFILPLSHGSRKKCSCHRMCLCCCVTNPGPSLCTCMLLPAHHG